MATVDELLEQTRQARIATIEARIDGNDKRITQATIAHERARIEELAAAFEVAEKALTEAQADLIDATNLRNSAHDQTVRIANQLRDARMTVKRLEREVLH